MLSQLVGEKGHVTGIDMTEDQVLYILHHGDPSVIHSAFRKYSDHLSFFTYCYVAASC